MSRNIWRKIKNLTKEIASSYKPEKIILFGSAAWGRWRADSDLDLLIVKRTKKDPFKRSYEVRSHIDADLPLDVLVYTPRELKSRYKLGDSFIREIVDKGKVLYAR